jgi:hypothetical protein
MLSMHWRGAGENAKAAAHAVRAAEQAAAALAFDRAARLYLRALELDPLDPVRAAPFHIRLGDALANAGRGEEAAAAYLAAAPYVDARTSLDLRRRAADQLLKSGRIDDGLAVIDSVLRSLGTGLPRSPRGALVSLLFRRARLRLRGLGFRVRSEGEVPADALARIDTFWSVAAGLAITDIIRGADFQTRGTLLALDTGEPYRVARALATEAGFASSAGVPSRARTTMLLDAAESVAGTSGHPHAIAMAAAARGMAAYLTGRFREALERLDAGYVALRDRCTNVSWEIHTAQQYACLALAHLGEMAELRRRVPALLRDAQAHGNLYAQTSLRTAVTNLAWLVSDEPERAHDELVIAMRQWSRRGFHLQHHWRMLSQGQIDLYVGDHEAGYQRVVEQWPALERSLLLRVQICRVEAMHLRARLALAVAGEAGAGRRAELLAEAARWARAIEKEQLDWASPLAWLVRAGVAWTTGRAEEARRWLASAAEAFAAAEMALFAAATRWRLFEMSDGDARDSLERGVETWARREEIVNAPRLFAMLAPGLAVVVGGELQRSSSGRGV